ncbi:FAD binding domain protein [Apiospora rasikravindrae]|uniref:FAD binding domain protein n=1 Tax=Apiospora rasikravindrae TaxID=990691 RepID=A0ABR1SF94_9PEZI
MSPITRAEHPFRIIVVGAGVAGLTASHCLQKLGIDHVVLEKQADIAPPLGAGISMWPHGLRILNQLGCLQDIEKSAVSLNRFLCRGPDGRLIHDNALYTHVQENHGIGFFPLERQNFLQILYDSLPNKSPVRTGRAVEDVEQFSDRVEVRLSTGEIEVGDMVLGCDGVHSLVRSAMWDYATRTSPGLVQAKEKTSLKTSWKTLIFITPGIPALGERDLTVTYNDGFTFLVTSQPDAVYFFVIFRREKPFTWPKREHHTEADVEKLAAQVLDKPVTDQLLFSEVWKRRTRASVVSLEEYVLEHWHHGRIVLAGDAVHKVHPNMGLGGNSAIEGIASLMNHIHRVLPPELKQIRTRLDGSSMRNHKPSGTALNMAFAAYQKERQHRMRELMDLSTMVAKMHTYATPLHRFMANWMMPLLDDRRFANRVGSYIATAPKLDFLPDVDFACGRLPWTSNTDEKEEEEVLFDGILAEKSVAVSA